MVKWVLKGRMAARMIAVLEMHGQITVGWELGSEQMKQN